MDKMQTIFNWAINNKFKTLVVLLILIGISYFGYQKLNPNTTQSQYQTTQAEKGTLITSVTASGTISQGSSVSITTQATGVINQVYVKDGDEVIAGQKIADITLDTNSLQKQTAAWASYQAAQNSLASANAKINSLQSSLFAANRKFINDAVARDLTTDDPTYIEQHADWLQAEADYNNQQGIISQAQSAQTSAWLSYIQLSPTITAPTTGTISGLTLTPGLAITNNSNSTTASNPTILGTISLDQNQTQATVNLTQIDVTKVKVGQKVTMTLDALPDEQSSTSYKTFTGIVSTINTNGSVSSNVTSYPATITFDNPSSSVYPNMSVNATIITDIKDNVILVPSSAVQTTNGQSTVRVLKNNQPNAIPVTLGGSNDTQTAIVSGLNEGDEVITSETNSTSTSTTTSPFGNTRSGFGGFGGGGQMIRINR